MLCPFLPSSPHSESLWDHPVLLLLRYYKTQNEQNYQSNFLKMRVHGKPLTDIFYSLFFCSRWFWICSDGEDLPPSFFFLFASMEHMVMKLYITISWQLFQIRYFSYLNIYMNIQASSWGRFSEFLLKYSPITLVIVCQTCPPLGWLPMFTDVQTT